MLPALTSRFLHYCDNFLFPHECAYARGHYGDLKFVVTENVDGDSGGLTKWGIDQASHPNVNIAKLTADDARALFFWGDWAKVGAEHLPPGYGEILCDIHVNGGDYAEEVQQALNVSLPNGQKLLVDGDIGPKTIAAMVAEGKAGILSLLHVREGFYQIVAQRPGKAKFLQGWQNRVDDLTVFALSLL